MKQSVQNTVSSAVSSAFFLIGFSGKNSNTYPSLNPVWIIDLETSNHLTGAHKDSSYQSYSGKIITASGEKLDIIGVHDFQQSVGNPIKLQIFLWFQN